MHSQTFFICFWKVFHIYIILHTDFVGLFTQTLLRQMYLHKILSYVDGPKCYGAPHVWFWWGGGKTFTAWLSLQTLVAHDAFTGICCLRDSLCVRNGPIKHTKNIH